MPDVIYKDNFNDGISLKSMDIFLSVKQVESSLNQLIDFINSSGGEIWMQDPDNKDFIIKLDRNVIMNFYYTECVRLNSEVNDFD